MFKFYPAVGACVVGAVVVVPAVVGAAVVGAAVGLLPPHQPSFNYSESNLD